MTGVESNTHTIVEVADSHWIDAPRPDEAEWVGRALAGLAPWYYGCVPKSITGEKEEKSWTRRVGS